MAKRDYNHSRPLDVHRWSEHPEANKFVNFVYENYLDDQRNENKRIQKAHLKVVLLDLYIGWLDDPDLNIAVHMTEGAYSDGTVFTFEKGKKSRYNKLNTDIGGLTVRHSVRHLTC